MIDPVWPGSRAANRTADDTADVLRRYWHPVALSSELGDGPLGTRLLETPIVVWRSSSGVSAFYDLCVHRGTPLTMGRIEGDRLVCGFHGWNYDISGECVGIPALPTGRAIPPRARVTAYHAEERHGLVWVSLDDPIADIPAFPDEYTDDAYTWEDWLIADVKANAARFIENTMDQSHFAFVHAGILAVEPQVSEPEVEHRSDGFFYAVENPHNTFAKDGPREWSAYRLVTPFTVFLTRYQPGNPQRQIFGFLCSPVSSKETKLFRIGGRNFVRFDPEEEARRARIIFDQDRTFVEAQRPEELPIDLREELHIKGPDGAAVEYRRLLGRLGVTWR